MIGFSIDLIDEMDDIVDYMERMSKAGFNFVFATIYEPDENIQGYILKAKEIAKVCKRLNINMMFGTSVTSLAELNLELGPELLKDIGVTSVRVSKSTPNHLIANLSNEFIVAVSASHVLAEDLDEIESLGGRIENIEAWFHYYERNEIGISGDYLIERTKFWQDRGVPVYAFVPGDNSYEDNFVSKITLERHRGRHPLYCTIDLFRDMGLDGICIGDSPIRVKTIYQFSRFMREEVLALFVDVLDDEYFPLISGEHKNRIDEARDVIRAEDRVVDPEINIIDRYLVSRPKGALTIDNHRNGRFMGEFHIGKVDLPLSRKVNVVAHLREEDIDLLEKCRGGDIFHVMENLTNVELRELTAYEPE